MPAAYVLTIAGATKTLVANSLTITEPINGRSTLTCAINSLNGSYRPAIDDDVVLTENGARIFGGVINKPSEAGIGGLSNSSGITTRISAVDYNSLADRRFQIGGGFPATTTLKSALTSLVGLLTPYGVTLDPAQVTGPSLPTLGYDVTKLTDILDELSTITGYVWEIDYSKVLRMYQPGSLPSAPFGITEGAGGNAIGDLTVEPSRTDYANRIIVLAGDGVRDVSDALGTGNGTTVTYTLNYPLFVDRGYVTNAGVNETLGTGATWTYNATTNAVTRTSAPAVGNAIVMPYAAQFPVQVQSPLASAEPTAEQTAHKLWERVVTLPEIFDKARAQAWADGLLTAATTGSKVVTFVTEGIGLKRGQLINITSAKRNLSLAAYLIQEIRTTQVGTVLRRTVTAISGTVLQTLSWRNIVKGWSGGGSTNATTAIMALSVGSSAVGSGTPGSLAQWITASTIGNVTAVPAGLLTGTVPAATLTGRSLVDLGTRSASDLSSGNLPYARMPTGSGTWTATPTISGNTVIGGTLNVNASISTPASTNLTLNPTGDLILGPTGVDVLPNIGYTVNLGALTNKYLTLHAAELWVETLVAQNTIATIGGRVLVAPTNILTADLSSGATSISVKYNNFANGDRVYMEANGSLEWMAITSAPSGSGPYTYTVTRNLDGTGANAWTAGDAILNTGTTGNGFIDLYSLGGVLSGSGPAIVGNVRTGTTYNNIAPRWAIGNLNGLYGYGVTTFGFAAGDPSGPWIKVDATNGVRLGFNTTTKAAIDGSGNASFASGNVTIDINGLQIAPATSFSTAFPQTRAFAFTPTGSKAMGTYGYEVSNVNYIKVFSQSASSGASAELSSKDVVSGSAIYAGFNSEIGVTFTGGPGARATVLAAVPGSATGVNTEINLTATPGTGGIGTINLNATSICERGRTTGIGDWIAVAYSSGNFTAGGSMTWTVASGDQAYYAYTLIGKTLILIFGLNTTTVGGTVNPELRIAIPGGFTAARTTDSTFNYFDNGTTGTGLIRASSGSGTVSLYKSIGAPNWSLSTDNTYVTGQIALEIS